MPNVMGFVRRINMEPVGAGRQRKVVCHAFVAVDANIQIDVYTDQPRLEAALFTALGGGLRNEERGFWLRADVHYDDDGGDNIVSRVDVERIENP